LEENEFSVEYILENGLDKSAYGFIYITTNNLDGMKYIGQKMFNVRWIQYLGSGTRLINAIRKYGKGSFSKEIVSFAYSKEELNDMEIKFIKYYNADSSDNYYNIASGGSVFMAGKHHSKDSKNKMSESRKGKVASSETKQKMSKWQIGRKLSEKTKEKMKYKKSDETKQKLSELAKGRIMSSETRLKISKANKGKIVSEETKIKLKLINTGKIMSEESKIKMKNSRNISKYLVSISCICVTTLKRFGSLADAGLFYSISSSSITRCCRHKSKSSGKHPITGEKLVWMYYDGYIKSQSLIKV